MFLKNAWYVAAWSHEIDNSLRQIIVLDEKICVFRNSDGEVIALEDACPHRKLPLSKGRIKGDNVECGYHDRETRYYWFQLRNVRPQDDDLSRMMAHDVRAAFSEDKAVLEQVQIGMTEKTSPHIDLSIDAGQLRFRRQLEAMIAEEQLVDQKMMA